MLLFQKDIVESHLEVEDNRIGGEYLKKIIQVGFDIPTISKYKVMQFLFKELEKTFSDESNNFNSDYLAELRSRGVEKFFSNLRDVNTFLNSFKFHLGLFKGERSLNVNYVDLFALELLRVFEHNVYESLHSHKVFLTKLYSSGSELPLHKQNLHNAITRITSRSSEKNKESVQGILSVIFPNIEWNSQKSYNSRISYQNSINQVRVTNELYFDRYFSFKIDDDELGESDVARIKESLGNRSMLLTVLNEINDKGQLDQALLRMKMLVNEIKPELAKDFITALCDISDDIPTTTTGGYDLQPVWNLWATAYWYLQKLDDTSRFEVLRHAITETHGLFLPLDLVAEEYRIKDKAKNGKDFQDHQFYSESELYKLKLMCIEKLRTSKYAGYRLAEHKLFSNILPILKRIESDADLKKRIQDDIFGHYDHFFLFLKALVQERTGRISYQDVESFVDIEKFEEQIKKISEWTTSPSHKEILKIWDETLNRKANGIVDDSKYN